MLWCSRAPNFARVWAKMTIWGPMKRPMNPPMKEKTISLARLSALRARAERCNWRRGGACKSKFARAVVSMCILTQRIARGAQLLRSRDGSQRRPRTWPRRRCRRALTCARIQVNCRLGQQVLPRQEGHRGAHRQGNPTQQRSWRRRRALPKSSAGLEWQTTRAWRQPTQPLALTSR